MEKNSCKLKFKKRLVQQYLYRRKIDFKTKGIIRTKKQHYIMIKGAIQQEDITLVNIYVPSVEAPKYWWT